MDLLRVISHHRARLATPIRTVQKIYSDTDLENVPFADSIYNRGGVRPFLLIEPPYKINGEEKTKSRPVRTHGERDGKATVRPTSEINTDVKVGPAPLDSKNKETPPSETIDTKADGKLRETTNSNTKEDNKAGTASTSDKKSGDKVVVKSTPKPVSKTNFKALEMSDSESVKAAGSTSDISAQQVSNNKQPKNSGLENPAPNTSNKASSLSLEIGGEKAGVFSTSAQVKQDPQPPSSRPTLEENLVLGVALEGSKRTLPIEEGMDPPPSCADMTELTSRHNGNGSSTLDKGKKDGQFPASPSSKSVEP